MVLLTVMRAKWNVPRGGPGTTKTGFSLLGQLASTSCGGVFSSIIEQSGTLSGFNAVKCERATCFVG